VRKGAIRSPSNGRAVGGADRKFFGELRAAARRLSLAAAVQQPEGKGRNEGGPGGAGRRGRGGEDDGDDEPWGSESGLGRKQRLGTLRAFGAPNTGRSAWRPNRRAMGKVAGQFQNRTFQNLRAAQLSTARITNCRPRPCSPAAASPPPPPARRRCARLVRRLLRHAPGCAPANRAPASSFFPALSSLFPIP
jgi:hypothetical protein